MDAPETASELAAPVGKPEFVGPPEWSHFALEAILSDSNPLKRNIAGLAVKWLAFPMEAPISNAEKALLRAEMCFARAMAVMIRGEHDTDIGNERMLVDEFLADVRAGNGPPTLEIKPEDKFIREMSFKYGRADLVFMHQDGWATVVEAKNGDHGYSRVVAGIGQAALYGAQLPRSVRGVRRALLWSSSGSAQLDATIERACEDAGTTPIKYPTARAIAACAASDAAIASIWAASKNAPIGWP